MKHNNSYLLLYTFKNYSAIIELIIIQVYNYPNIYFNIYIYLYTLEVCSWKIHYQIYQNVQLK